MSEKISLNPVRPGMPHCQECVANIAGMCVAEKCRGATIVFLKSKPSMKRARQIYKEMSWNEL